MTVGDEKTADPVSTEIKQIIDDVFSISGQKISNDDPIIAVLLYQKQQLAVNRAELEQHDTNFFINLDQRFEKINRHYEEMEKQKSLIVSELIGKNKKLVPELVKEELQKQKPNHEIAFFVVLGILIFTQFLMIVLTIFK
ncbi:hypothetical protein [Advenella alkanexedens]|uniref:hypothetical protein n=1 Tax=Advenella alkanexedens TaxID=1481665 RepID=UPI0026747722|nr:hypothetical protein [Advenella alkanexedens]WKU18789.1 hypothetical protein Q3V95_10860 [Advenella alkanexedens]